jgi:hypothetical protein
MENKDYFSQKIANSISAILAYWDKDLLCRFANHAYLDWFVKKSEDMIDKMTLKELLGPLYPKNLPYIEEADKGNIQVLKDIAKRSKSAIRELYTILQPSFSLGIAVYPDNGKTPEELFRYADQALYKSKEQGKNCYYFYEETT